MISSGYNRVIDQKKSEIQNLKGQIKQLQSRGKNLSKNDIMSFADLEQERFLWASNLELLGAMTPDDMAITGMRFKHIQFISIIFIKDTQLFLLGHIVDFRLGIINI